MNETSIELTELWNEAVNEYISKSAKRNSVAQKWKSPINTTADLDHLIEEHESAFSQFRSSRGKFWKGLMSTFAQLQRLGNIAQAGLAPTPYAPASVIIQSGLFLISSGEAVADTYDAIETLFKKIRDITDRVDEYLKGDIDQKLQRVIIKLLGSLLDVFSEAEAAIRRGRGKEMMRRVVGKENKVQVALNGLEEWVQTELSLVTTKTYVITQRINEKADAERDQNLIRVFLSAEAAADNDGYSRTIESSRLSRSGDWLLGERLFGKWFQMEFPVLWILGKPGTGKTYLASRVLSHLKENAKLTGRFYIREGMNTQHTPEVILKVIAHQITGQYDLYRRHAVTICKKGSNLLGLESIWESLFLQPFSNDDVNPLFIVIDGLDEATPQNQELLIKIAKKLSDLRSTGRMFPAIQMLLLGRPELEYNVSNVWGGERRRPRKIDIQPSLSKADVERFICKGVAKGIPLLQRMQRMQPGPSKRLKKEIIKTLVDSSDGMFMLAKLMLAEVKNMNKPELVRKALAKPPQGLDDMFKRVITRLVTVGGFDKNDLNEMIMWVACAKRDLLLGELDLVLKLRDLKQNGIVGLEEELRTRFGSFFSVISRVDDSENEEADEDGEEDGEDEIRDDTSSIGSETSGSDYESNADSKDYDHASHGENDDDEYEEEDIPDRFFTATVKFGHASIGQHFRTAPFHEGIGMNLSFSQMHLTLTCLLFLTDNIPKRKQKNPSHNLNPYLYQYSVDHFLDHLEDLNFEELKSLHTERFEKLSDEVRILFRSRKSLLRWYNAVSDQHRFVCQLLSKNTCFRLRHCFPELSSSSEGNKISDAKQFEILFTPFARYVAEDWLRWEIRDPILAVLFLHGYQSLRRDQLDKSWTLPSNRPFEHIAEGIVPEEILEMASLGKVEKNSMWHFALGCTLSNIKTRAHLLAAAAQLRSAIELSEDPDAKWDAYQVMAHVYKHLGQYQDAMGAASKALEIYPKYRYYNELLVELIQNANLRSDQRQAAFKTSLKVWESSPRNHIAAFNMILAAHKVGQYSETVKILKSAVENEKDAMLLGKIFSIFEPERYTTEYMSIACVMQEELDTARDAFIAMKNAAAKRKDTGGMALADVALARLYYAFYQDTSAGIQLFETVVKDYPDTKAAFAASHALASVYFTEARESIDQSEMQTWLSKLEQLVDLVEPMSPYDGMFPSKNEVSALLGKWYAQHGQMDQAHAKIQPMITQAIRELTDRDESNDREAYCNLARGLMCSGDRSSAAIAHAFTYPLQMPKELLQHTADQSSGDESTSESVDTTDDETFDFQGRCDGGCNRLQVLFKSFRVCEVCVDVAFCDECHGKLMDGTPLFKICDPRHTFIEVYPPRGLVTREAGQYRIHLEGKTVDFDEWVGMISRQWL